MIANENISGLETEMIKSIPNSQVISVKKKNENDTPF
jgi:hypothetical protein